MTPGTPGKAEDGRSTVHTKLVQKKGHLFNLFPCRDDQNWTACDKWSLACDKKATRMTRLILAWQTKNLFSGIFGICFPSFLPFILFYFISFRSISFHVMSFHSAIPVHSTPFHCVIYIQFHCIPLHSIAFHCMPLHSIAFHCIPLHSIAFIHSLTHLFIYSFIHSFIHSFIFEF